MSETQNYLPGGEEDQRDRYPLSLAPNPPSTTTQTHWRFAMDSPDIIRRRLLWLAQFAAVFETPRMVALRDLPPSHETATLWQAAIDDMSHLIYGQFHTGAYETGWVDLDAPWGAWKGTREARAFQKDFIAEAQRATPLQVHKLITTICRSDRLSEGQIESCFSNGWFEALFKRADVLLKTEFAS